MTVIPRTSTKESELPNSWTDALEAITINDENWWCTITMIVETMPCQARLVQLFNEAAEKGSRRAIHPLTFNKIMNSVRTLSKIDQEKCPAAQRVFHHANKIIDRGERLDAFVMARLVKYLVYQSKMENIAMFRREADLEHETDRNIRAMLPTTNAESLRSIKSAKSKKSSKTLDASVVPKPHTHLKRRGEESVNQVYVDDAPEDGPNLFIVLSGLRDPNIPLELVRAGLPLTCILKINRPRESPIDTGNFGTDLEESQAFERSGKSNGSEDSMETELSEFWSHLETSKKARENLDDYSGVISQTFCPPKISLYGDAEDVQKSEKDLYDRISCILYDIYELQLLHAEYIKSMKLQSVPLEAPKDHDAYKRIMNQVPTECSVVSIILQAMLAQVEINLQDEQPLISESTNLTTMHNKTGLETISASKYNEDLPIPERSNDGKRFRRLSNFDNSLADHSNIKESNIRQLSNERPILSEKFPAISNICSKVILECDELRLKTYHVDLGDDIMNLINPIPTSLADLGARSFRDPRIIDLWVDRDIIPEDTMKKYRNYISKMARCYSVPMDAKRLVHYLHLRAFDKMIHGGLNGTSTGDEDHEILIADKDVILIANRSDPFPLSSKTIQVDRTLASARNPIFNSGFSKSDSIIDYRVSEGDIVEGPGMLPAPRDSLQWREKHKASPKASEKNLGNTEGGCSYLEEFIDVRILSDRTLPQTVHRCFQAHLGFHSQYIAITDSMLLCFGDLACSRCSSNVDGAVDEQIMRNDDGKTLKIVTPVCLRDFCEYVIHEIKDFVRDVKISRTATRSVSAGELTRKLSRHSDIAILDVTTFTDDDFIIPSSLKGQAKKQLDTNKTFEEADKVSNKFEKQRAKSEKSDKRKMEKVSVVKGSSDKSLRDTRKGEVTDSMTVRKAPSLRCAGEGEPYKFVGYDLGNFRVQLNCRNEKFVSSDGTLVNVNFEEWLYRKRRVEVGIELSGCFLKLQSNIGDRENSQMPCHLITENGIIVAFVKVEKIQESSIFDEGPSFLPFEFRISWPSGLLVEAVRGDGQENPFYIQQRYISKGPECQNVSRESYRKFLRNGTVLKFLDSNEIEVLRPNGTIVRCLEYERTSGDFASRPNGNLGKDELIKSKTRETLTGRKQKLSNSRKRSGKNFGDDRTRSPSTMDPSIVEFQVYSRYLEFLLKLVTSMLLLRFFFNSTASSPKGDIQATGKDAARVKITRCTVVEHDGRRYEVVNDEVSRVYNKSLVRTSTDVEAAEKLTRRDDGTKSIWNSKGELLIYFPDGTRIITAYVVEDEPLFCDWSDDEFARYFESGRNDGSKEWQIVRAVSSDPYDVKPSTNRDERAEILSSEAFVSVLMTCRMEHECYATVAYEPIKRNCQLSMPDDLEIQINGEGLFDISFGEKTELLLRPDEIIFSSKISDTDRSVSTYNLPGTRKCHETNENLDTLLVTTDSKGQVFRVNVDGSVSRSNETSSNIERKCHRLFAVNRDSSGCEYIHKSQRHEYKMKVNFDEESDSILIPIGKAGFPEYRLFLHRLEPWNYSRKWLQKAKEVGGSGNRNINFPRSTYAKPYDWLFPFGRQNDSGKKDDCSLKKPILDAKVLALTIFVGIAKEGDCFLQRLEEAMARCRQKPSEACPAYDPFHEESLRTSSEERLKKWLNALALGIETNIDVERYLRDLSRERAKDESVKSLESSMRCKLRKLDLVGGEDIRWYERCIRERIILPYFKNIRGSCFLWITSCVDRALQLVE